SASRGYTGRGWSWAARVPWSRVQAGRFHSGRQRRGGTNADTSARVLEPQEGATNQMACARARRHFYGNDQPRTCSQSSGEQPARGEQLEHPLDLAFDARATGAEHEIGLVRRLIRRAHSGEAGELAGPSARIEALRVALLAHLQRRVDEHLDEVQLIAGVQC